MILKIVMIVGSLLILVSIISSIKEGKIAKLLYGGLGAVDRPRLGFLQYLYLAFMTFVALFGIFLALFII